MDCSQQKSSCPKIPGKNPNMPAKRQTLPHPEQNQDPCCFLCGETPVWVRFSPDGRDLGQILKNYLLSRRR